MDLGTPERYREADRLLGAGQLKLGYLKPTVTAQEPALQPAQQTALRGPSATRPAKASAKASRASRTGR